ncbi:MAG: Eco57I restriction-modification methylase domain-containing protein [Jaaginema sp. PMC 1079.18]|nr:Eco57I restriction-modification methylase domain-containing protein [Jaaginema sp. PMC 1080.18]MEC4852794.1 Eco57I restriction-modification methylase domain-containing protein [Jaaginema sp. PMC 1079.18]MEC4867781.1 Eco57I restriction-modification methylase domain-containing protein [Jaaginema sp. PMC 1078.18]
MAKRSLKPLFHGKTLNLALSHFHFPDDLEKRHQIVMNWVDLWQSGKLTAMNEVSLHGQFLGEIFQEVLGYQPVTKSEIWEIYAETSISDGGGSADGALGFFTAVAGKKNQKKLEGKIVAPIELKGAKNNLDKITPGRKESAVDQGWRYANYTPDCRWIIVSNYQEIRLYQTSKTPAYGEVFYLEDLADIDRFKRFYLLLCRDNFLPKSLTSRKPALIDQLLSQSSEAEEAITQQLYSEYKQVRLNLAKHFRNTTAENISDNILIEKAQKTLDRLLFIAFCEDKQLLPHQTIKKAHDYQDPYNPRTIWDNYKAVFRSVDEGNEILGISGYNGGLFKTDSLLDEVLQVSDVICSQLCQLSRFDFDTEVSVDILGRIFEQSVTDLEELRALATGEQYDRKQGKRKKQGVFYTPAFITQYIAQVALGGYLEEKEAQLRAEFELDKISKRATKKQQEAEIKFWEAYRDTVLRNTRIVDPACGSGAFLIAAFDLLLYEYERVNTALRELKGGQLSVFDLNKTILNHNLYGVDLSPESVEITKLSLWLKTAEPGKPLTYLDDNIKCGNSIIADESLDDFAFDWEAVFSDVFADGGFDVVLGNPPYVRQELLSPFKAYLEKHYQCYNGVADLYTYFYEKGVNILKPKGILAYIVTNKWLRAGYGEALRKFFSENSVFEQIVDFGHAPIFQDADTFPCIISLRKPENESLETRQKSDDSVWVCPVPREDLADINLTQYVENEGYSVPWNRFTQEAWSLEPPAVDNLMAKIKSVGVPLRKFTGVKPCYGIKTGFNQAFLIDDETRNNLVKADPKSAEVIKPYLRGQDIKRWSPEWQNLWMIFAHKDININKYSAVKEHLNQHRIKLEKRAGKQLWWQLQASPSFYDLFDEPKLIYQEIQFHPSYSYDLDGYFTNNKCFILPSSDLFILAVLNSPLIWWHNWRYLPHMKDEALSPAGYLMETLPIAPPSDEIRNQIEPLVSRLIEITKTNQEAKQEILDWLRIEQNIEKLGRKLEDFANIDCETFIKEVKKRRPKNADFSPKRLKEIRAAYNDYAPAMQARQAEALQLEQQLSDLVNQAYGLTPEEIDLMWRTAPPRMPINRP